MIKSYSRTWLLPWPTLLLLGAIHGNEPCGPVAIQRVLKELEDGVGTLNSWKLLAIPVCNPKGYEQWVRYCENNLNRVFKPWFDEDSYEWRLAIQIREVMQRADYVLDLHSLSSAHEQFLFRSSDTCAKSNDFAQATQIPTVLSESKKLYEWTQERATEDYADYLGVPGVCVECGQHDHPESNEVAYRTIINCMVYLWLIDGRLPTSTDQQEIVFVSKQMMQKPWSLTKQRKHGDKVSVWEVIAVYDDGEPLICEEEWMIMLLPKHFAMVWGEWFFLGKEV